MLQRCLKRIDDLAKVERATGELSAESNTLFTTLRGKVKLLAFRIAVLHGFSRTLSDKQRPPQADAPGLFTVAYVRSFTEVRAPAQSTTLSSLFLEAAVQGIFNRVRPAACCCVQDRLRHP